MNAEDTYNERTSKARQQMALLEELLNKHNAERLAHNKNDWNKIGDLGYLNEQLEVIIRFMS